MIHTKGLQHAWPRRRSEDGFTIIELIIVIAVIGVLTAIAIPVYGAIQSNARERTVIKSAKIAHDSAAWAVEDEDPATTPATEVGRMDVASDQLTLSIVAGADNGDVDSLCIRSEWDNASDNVPVSEVGAGCS